MLREWLPYLIIALVAVVLIAATVVLSRMAWRRQVRRYLIGLVGRREAIGAVLKSAEGAIKGLSESKVTDLLAFARSESEERRTFAEIASRMRIEAQEIAELPLPKKLWQLADVLGAAAVGVAEQTGAVGDSEGEPALDALVALDLRPVHEALREADKSIAELSAVYDLDDPSVYGGGLYI